MGRGESKAPSMPLGVAEFYDRLAPEYDAMTGFDQRFVREKPFFRLLVERYGIKTALDAGCGSGFHSILVSEMGVQVTAVDASKEMLELTRRHAHARGVKVRLVQSSFQHLPEVLNSKFDAVFVMGNSLPHLLTEKELGSSLAGFSSLLKPEGILFAQLLNYDRILATRDQILQSREIGDKTVVRQYEYDEEGILFSILTRSKSADATDERRKTIRLRPLGSLDLTTALKKSNFSAISMFGGISMETFDPASSKDLVVLARK